MNVYSIKLLSTNSITFALILSLSIKSIANTCSIFVRSSLEYLLFEK